MQAVLTLLLDANLKSPLYAEAVAQRCSVISNFEKQNVPLLTKNFFSQIFQSCKL